MNNDELLKLSFDRVGSELEAWHGVAMGESRGRRFSSHYAKTVEAMKEILNAETEEERAYLAQLHGIVEPTRPEYPPPGVNAEIKKRYAEDMARYEALLHDRKKRGITPYGESEESLKELNFHEWSEEK